MKLATHDLIKDLRVSRLDQLESRSGIKERRVCSGHEDSFTLALQAAKDCLKYSEYKANDIDMIIVCSITRFKDGLRHQYEPTLAMGLKRKLGANNAIAFDISNACTGMLTGVYIADSYIRNGNARNCLVVSGEFITNIAKNAINRIKTPRSNQIASLTVGDSGSAVIMDGTGESDKGLYIEGFHTLSKYNKLCMGRQGRKFAGGYMKTNARKIHRASISSCVPIVEKALKECGLTFGQIDYLIPHQTSKSSILSGGKVFEKHFGELPVEILNNLERVGNTSSTSHFVALYKYLKEGKIGVGDRIMLLGLASGINICTIIFTMNEMTVKYGN